MNAVTVFAAELVLTVVVSTAILIRLHALLRRLGHEACEEGGGATEFWLAYTQLMMIVAPVLLVAWFSHAGQHAAIVEQLKSSIGIVLCGQFIGLVLVGRAVWKTIVREPAPKAARVPFDVTAAKA